MSLSVAEEPRIVHALPGRVRVHLPDWEGQRQRGLEACLRQLRGVSDVRSSPLTRHVLVHFDPEETNDESILAALWAFEPDSCEEVEVEPKVPPVQRGRRGPAGGRGRLGVGGLDRDPVPPRRAVERLERWPTVKASANQLTGRVLVEFDENQVRLEDLISAVADVELPELPGEDRPTHPLDRTPLVQSGLRTTTAFLGLGLLSARRLFGLAGPPVGASGLATAAGVLGILEVFPTSRRALDALLGENGTELLVGTSHLALDALTGGVFSLVLHGVGALQQFTEARARREAYCAYEERVENAAPARPGVEVRLEPGERTPLAAEVLEGTGTAVGSDGLPAPVFPRGVVEAGRRPRGGPFTLRLRGEEPFVPEPRPAPVAGSFEDRYMRALEPISLVYATATGLLTRSLSRTFMSLLLVNPRTVLAGKQFANTGASARVIRAGVTVAGTRPERPVRLPDVLLLDGPRVITDGLEVSGVLPQVEGYDATEILGLASGIAAAAGLPWGRAFPAAGGGTAGGGQPCRGDPPARNQRGRGFLLPPFG